MEASSQPSLFNDENIFNWEYLETINKEPIQGDEDYNNYDMYK